MHTKSWLIRFRIRLRMKVKKTFILSFFNTKAVRPGMLILLLIAQVPKEKKNEKLEGVVRTACLIDKLREFRPHRRFPENMDWCVTERTSKGLDQMEICTLFLRINEVRDVSMPCATCFDVVRRISVINGHLESCFTFPPHPWMSSSQQQALIHACNDTCS